MFCIGNNEIRNQIEKDYILYEKSGKTLSHFFKRTIILAKKYTNSFNMERIKITYPDVLIIFGDKNGYFIDYDYTAIKAREPVEIEFNSLITLLDLKPFDLVNEYHENLNIYMIKTCKDRHGKTITQGVRNHGVPGISNAAVNIAVDQWPPSKIFWLPSSNLIAGNISSLNITRVILCKLV